MSQCLFAAPGIIFCPEIESIERGQPPAIMGPEYKGLDDPLAPTT